MLRSSRLETTLGRIKVDISILRRSVAEATETRKAENAEFTTVKAQNNAAVQLLGVAENRLNKSALRRFCCSAGSHMDCTSQLQGSRSAESGVLRQTIPLRIGWSEWTLGKRDSTEKFWNRCV